MLTRISRVHGTSISDFNALKKSRDTRNIKISSLSTRGLKWSAIVKSLTLMIWKKSHFTRTKNCIIKIFFIPMKLKKEKMSINEHINTTVNSIYWMTRFQQRLLKVNSMMLSLTPCWHFNTSIEARNVSFWVNLSDLDASRVSSPRPPSSPCEARFKLVTLVGTSSFHCREHAVQAVRHRTFSSSNATGMRKKIK